LRSLWDKRRSYSRSSSAYKQSQQTYCRHQLIPAASADRLFMSQGVLYLLYLLLSAIIRCFLEAGCPHVQQVGFRVDLILVHL
jgi:hypothetical protein